MNKQLCLQRAFTLVELAIVMTIIGLLIGGILKGQELLENARVMSTVAQVKSYDAAVAGFRDVYDFLPGDLPNAGDKITGCDANCNPVVSTEAYGTAGDGIIGTTEWAFSPEGGTDLSIGLAQGSGSTPDSVDDEFKLFWIHLVNANFLTSPRLQPLPSGTYYAADVTEPSAKIGGGFVITYFNPTGSHREITGNYYLLGSTYTLYTQAQVSSDPGQQVLTPARAAQIDKKIDDGEPASGSVVAYGVESSCYADVNSDGRKTYVSSVTSKDCGLIISLQR